jgi:outer membrane protein assembly factor BamB
MEWNVSIPTGLKGSARFAFFGDRILGSTARPLVPDIGRDDQPIEMWCISVKPGEEGRLLWQKSWQPPPGDFAIAQGDASLEDGVFTMYAKEIRAHFAFDLDTGNMIWGPTESEPYPMTFMMHIKIRLGKLISTGYSGVVYAYDLHTGDRLWTYEAKDDHSEMLWANNWALYPAFSTTDGKLVFFNTEHSTIDPKARGSPLICLDGESGQEIWSLNFRGHHWGGHPLIADSIIVSINSYDNQIYAIGKGPSAMSIDAPLTASPLGSNVMIRGRVTDVSAGTEGHNLKSRFPDGLPVVDDSSMSEWMEYVYMQHERPTVVNGVQIKIEAVDPNNNYQNLGTTMSDSYGNFGFAFEPEVPGTYMIIASFEGSGAYWGATTTSYLVVDPVSTPTTPIEPDQPVEPEAPLINTEMIIVAVVAILAIIGLGAFWYLRKR